MPDAEQQQKLRKSLTQALPPRHTLTATIRDLDARLEFAVDGHQAPFILPVLVRRVELHLPRLVESFEPVETPIVSTLFPRCLIADCW